MLLRPVHAAFWTVFFTSLFTYYAHFSFQATRTHTVLFISTISTRNLYLLFKKLPDRLIPLSLDSTFKRRFKTCLNHIDRSCSPYAFLSLYFI
jgi:hypothetical protein